MEFMVSHMSLIMFMPSFMPCITSLLSQLLRWLKINFIRSKVNCGQYTVKIQDVFGQHQHFEVIFITWSRVDHDFSREALKSSKVQSCQIRVSLGEVNWTLTKHNYHTLYQLFPNQSQFGSKFNYLQLCVYAQVQKMLHLKDMS